MHPEPDRYEFAASDRFVSFGRAHDMLIVGHTLVWHQQTPAWVFADASGTARPTGRQCSRACASTSPPSSVATAAASTPGTSSTRRSRRTARCAGRHGSKRSATTTSPRRSQFAREADPDAELYYNDYNLWKPAKRDGAIALVNRLRQEGVRVDGIGEQAHWGLTEPPIAQIDAGDRRARRRDRRARVALTELDVDVLPREPDMWGADLSRKARLRATTNIYPDGLPDAQQRQLAQRYADIFEVVLRHRAAHLASDLLGRHRRAVMAARLSDSRPHQPPAAVGSPGAAQAGARRGGRGPEETRR